MTFTGPLPSFILNNATCIVMYLVICLIKMASSSRVESSVLSLPVQFHPPKPFSFPKRRFGMKSERSFKAEWCEDGKFPWLHCDIDSDSAFCHLCMTAAHEGKLLASTRRDPAILSKVIVHLKST